ncbi:hypothetical protein BVY04_01185 [bacterium M21]|nr:hypothetical protein BVY04_01185 [bacterium M21]
MSSKPETDTRRIRGSVRLRLTIAYATLFLLAACLLTVCGYLLLNRHLLKNVDGEFRQTTNRLQEVYCGISEIGREFEGIPATDLPKPVQMALTDALPDYQLQWCQASRTSPDMFKLMGTLNLAPRAIWISAAGIVEKIEKGSKHHARQRMQSHFEAYCDRFSFCAILSADGQLISAATNGAGLPSTADLRQKVMVLTEGEQVFHLRYSPFLNTSHTLILGRDIQDVQSVLHAYTTTFIILLTFVFLLTSGASWLIANRAMQGVLRVAQTAEEISAGDLDARVTCETEGNEIRTLATAFNRMVDQTQQLLKEQRELTDNIAHDLRTPITRIRGTIETAVSASPTPEDYQLMVAQVMEDCEQLSHLINVTLEISQANAGTLPLHLETLDLNQEVERAIQLFQPLAQQKHQMLRMTASGATQLTADRTKIQRVIANLLDNAIKYTQDSGEIHIEIQESDEAVKLQVGDNGPGIPADQLESVFHRFYRVDTSRNTPGNGLGLSLVQAIIHAHKGEIRLVNVEPGLNVQINLPKITKG